LRFPGAVQSLVTLPNPSFSALPFAFLFTGDLSLLTHTASLGASLQDIVRFRPGPEGSLAALVGLAFSQKTPRHPEGSHSGSSALFDASPFEIPSPGASQRPGDTSVTPLHRRALPLSRTAPLISTARRFLPNRMRSSPSPPSRQNFPRESFPLNRRHRSLETSLTTPERSDLYIPRMSRPLSSGNVRPVGSLSTFFFLIREE